MVEALSVSPEAFAKLYGFPRPGLAFTCLQRTPTITPLSLSPHVSLCFTFAFYGFHPPDWLFSYLLIKDRPAIDVLSFITRQQEYIEAISGRSQHPVSHCDGQIIAAAISMFQCFNLWDTEQLYSRRRWIPDFGHYCGNLPPDNSSGHSSDCRISADFVNNDPFKSLAGTTVYSLPHHRRPFAKTPVLPSHHSLYNFNHP